MNVQPQSVPMAAGQPTCGVFGVTRCNRGAAYAAMHPMALPSEDLSVLFHDLLLQATKDKICCGEFIDFFLLALLRA